MTVAKDALRGIPAVIQLFRRGPVAVTATTEGAEVRAHPITVTRFFRDCPQSSQCDNDHSVPESDASCQFLTNFQMCLCTIASLPRLFDAHVLGVHHLDFVGGVRKALSVECTAEDTLDIPRRRVR